MTAEALYHLLGGKAGGYTPHTVRHEGAVHWYLVQNLDGFVPGARQVIDPTAAQFKTPPPYHEGRGRGFLTKVPSRRTREMMKRMLYG